jgi:hypothetical protein
MESNETIRDFENKVRRGQNIPSLRLDKRGEHYIRIRNTDSYAIGIFFKYFLLSRLCYGG